MPPPTGNATLMRNQSLQPLTNRTAEEHSQLAPPHSNNAQNQPLRCPGPRSKTMGVTPPVGNEILLDKRSPHPPALQNKGAGKQFQVSHHQSSNAHNPSVQLPGTRNRTIGVSSSFSNANQPLQPPVPRSREAPVGSPQITNPPNSPVR